MHQQLPSVGQILSKLDGHLHRNDYAAAERHLCYWLSEAEGAGNGATALTLRNELMGLYRKLGRRDEAVAMAESALAALDNPAIGNSVTGGTTRLNCATVYKAFGMADQAIPLFEWAREIYEGALPPTDSRLAGLYNNMALALVDVGRFGEADGLYRRALAIVEEQADGGPEAAVTYLNMASAAEARDGLEDGAEEIQAYLTRAEAALEAHSHRDGHYAFVCEKCASTFGYYGWFAYARELSLRARRIYEGN